MVVSGRYRVLRKCKQKSKRDGKRGLWATEDSSLFGQGLNNFAPETKMLIRGGSQASLPIDLSSIQPISATHTPGGHTLAEKTSQAAGLPDKASSPVPKNQLPGYQGQPDFGLPVCGQRLKQGDLLYLAAKPPR